MKKLGVILGCLLGTSWLYAEAPAEIYNSQTVTSQLVTDQSSAAPYMVTGESLVGLVKELVDFEGEGTSIAFHRKTGKLFVKQTPQGQKVVQSVLQQIRDYEPLQVMIEARIIEIDFFEGKDLGSAWDTFNKAFDSGEHTLSGAIPLADGSWGDVLLNPANELDLKYGFLRGSTKVDISIKALEQVGNVNTLSAPKIICFNNQRSNIKIETRTDYLARLDTTTVVSGNTSNTNQSADIETAVEGIVLDVTPTISRDGDKITLDLHPEVVELVKFDTVTLNNTGGQQVIKTPQYVKRTADTTVTVLDGGTIVIGGLMRRKEESNVRKVPFLGDIPFMKHLFSRETVYEQRSSLLIFITAKIWDESDAAASL